MSVLIIKFQCPKDHQELEFQLPLVEKTMTVRKLDAIPFSLYCPRCKWKGQLPGNRRTGLRRVD
jgi:hypothetical protein